MNWLNIISDGIAMAVIFALTLYGIRSLCKIFCMADTTSYENLPKHVKFIRHSDLSDGSCCHDEIIKRQS